ncbi:MAG: hypothetical protein IJ176_06870 [Prevotella sp.]|nr:hypothetical protein [Prevotella sp.]
MDAYFVCLANSLKRGGRCIAGVEVTIDDERKWTVVRKPDGSPRWIRPIDATTEFGEIRIGEAQHIPLLSVVKLEGVIPIPCQSHTEDVHYGLMRVVGKVSGADAVLSQFVDSVHQVFFYGTDRAIDIPTFATGDHSLMFIPVSDAKIVADVREDKTRYRMLLEYHGVVYDLSVTDPYYIEALNTNRVKLGKQSELYVTLSLGLVYEERHHKLIAGVIVPTSDAALSEANKIIDTKWEVRIISVVPLTSTERRTIRKAFVVPSQNGLAVCFRRRNGGEDFLPTDNAEDVVPWQRIALGLIDIVTYSDGKRAVRVRNSCGAVWRWIQKFNRFPKCS